MTERRSFFRLAVSVLLLVVFCTIHLTNGTSAFGKSLHVSSQASYLGDATSVGHEVPNLSDTSWSPPSLGHTYQEEVPPPSNRVSLASRDGSYTILPVYTPEQLTAWPVSDLVVQDPNGLRLVVYLPFEVRGIQLWQQQTDLGIDFGYECPTVETVVDEGVAEAAGILAGDTILAIDDWIFQCWEYESFLSGYKIGDVVTVVIRRGDGEVLQLPVSISPGNAVGLRSNVESKFVLDNGTPMYRYDLTPSELLVPGNIYCLTINDVSVDDNQDPRWCFATQRAPEGHLQYGDVILDSVDDWLGDTWSFFGEAGDTVIITTEPAAKLSLYSALGALVYSGPAIDLELPLTSEYRVIVHSDRSTGSDSNTPSSYSLTITKLEQHGLLELVKQGQLQSSGWITQSVTGPMGGDVWRLKLPVARYVLLEARHPQADIAIQLRNTDGDSIAAGENLVWQRVPPGEYEIVATYQLESQPEEKTYGLHYSVLESLADDPTGVIAYGQMVEAEMTDTLLHRWAFDCEVGDLIESSTVSSDPIWVTLPEGSSTPIFQSYSGPYRSPRHDAGGLYEVEDVDKCVLLVEGSTWADQTYQTLLQHHQDLSSTAQGVLTNGDRIDMGTAQNPQFGSWTFEGKQGEVLVLFDIEESSILVEPEGRMVEFELAVPYILRMDGTYTVLSERPSVLWFDLYPSLEEAAQGHLEEGKVRYRQLDPTISSTLTSLWEFNAEADSTYALHIVVNPQYIFDNAEVALLNEAGDVIESSHINMDWGTTLVEASIPEAGTYFWEILTAGEYAILLERLPNTQSVSDVQELILYSDDVVLQRDPSGAARSITGGNPLSQPANTSESQRVGWPDKLHFLAPKGQIIAVEYVGEFSPSVVSHAREGKLIEQLDEIVVGYEHRVQDSSVVMYQVNERGVVEISGIAEAEAIAVILGDEAPIDKGMLSMGETVQGHLGNWGGHEWHFSASVGESISLSIDSNNMDPTAMLISPSGAEILYLDDIGDNTNVVIDGYLVEETGVYSVIIRGFGGTRGAYELALEQGPLRSDGWQPPSVDTTNVIKKLEEAFNLEFVYVPAGEFTMGSNDEDAVSYAASPEHRIDLDGYWIATTEITIGQFNQFIESGGFQRPALWQHAPDHDASQHWDTYFGDFLNIVSLFSSPDYPVVVDWPTALAFANWLSLETNLDVTLPTEAQWEKAARGGDARIWPWGNALPLSKYLNCEGRCNDSELPTLSEVQGDGYMFLAPVGSYPEGASSYGVFDMAGNVWEWTSTIWGECNDDSPLYKYPYRSDDGREDIDARACRVIRGGDADSPPTKTYARDRDDIGLRGIRLVINDQRVLSEKAFAPDDAVATVGDEKILTSAFQKRIKYEQSQLENQYTQLNQLEQQFGDQGYFTSQISQIETTLSSPFSLGVHTLDHMIEETIIRQQAAVRGIAVSAVEIDAALREEIAVAVVVTDSATTTSLPPLTEEQFHDGIKQLTGNLAVYDMSMDDYREMVETRLLVNKLAKIVADERVRTTEEQVHARHILLSDVQLAHAIRQRILDGENFAVLAAEYSDDLSNNQNGGDLGWFGRSVMVPAFEEAVFALPVGEVSEPVETQFGVHLIEVLKRDNARPKDEATIAQERQQAYSNWFQAQLMAANIVRNDLESYLPHDLDIVDLN